MKETPRSPDRQLVEGSTEQTHQTDPLWTVVDVARYLRVETETVRIMARDGKLPAIKVGRLWRFHRSSIQEYLKNLQKAS